MTGTNVIRDYVFQGNQKAYDTLEFGLTVASAGIMEIGYMAREAGVSCCFVAGTFVLTKNGQSAIESIHAGDYVWAWDESTRDVSLKQVVETYISETTELTHIFVDGEEIVCTPTHPFYAPQKGWTDACKLRAGDILVLVNGEYVVVEKVQHELLEHPIKVYNFQVEDYHTYYVASGILVHNRCDASNLQDVSTGRTEPKNIQEQIAMQSVKSAPTAGQVIMTNLNDPRFPEGTVKMAQSFDTFVGKIQIHYNHAAKLGLFFDFKFKD